MKKLEKITGILILIALILRFYLIPGNGILTVLSLAILALIYYPFGFAFFNQIRLRRIFRKESYKGLSALKIIGAVSIGMTLSTICIGILFRLQHYPGAQLNLITGLVSTLIVLIIALMKFYKNKNEFYIRIFKRIAIIGSLGLILALTSDLTIAKIQFRDHPDYINALENYMNNPQSEELWKKKEWEYQKAILPEKEFELYKKETEKQNK